MYAARLEGTVEGRDAAGFREQARRYIGGQIRDPEDDVQDAEMETEGRQPVAWWGAAALGACGRTGSRPGRRAVIVEDRGNSIRLRLGNRRVL
jgi:hypothetical protein